MSKELTVEQEKLSSLISERLKSLRTSYTWIDDTGKQRKLSHDVLSQMLQNRHYDISKDSLINYEAPASHNTKKGKNLGMSVENLVALADFYGVTTDFILGRSELPISVEAYSNIASIANTPYKGTLNSFLSSSRLFQIISDIHVTRETIIREISEIFACEKPDITYMGIKEREARHIVRDLSEDIEKSLRQICEYNALLNAIEIKKEQT